MSAAIITAPATCKWIISKHNDLVWFIGSALVGYFALALISSAPLQTTEPLAFVWSVLIAGPHFFATATRTYFDREQRGKLGGLLWMIIPLCVLPFLIVWIGGKTILVVFGTLWGTYHVAKQHLGIIMLYKRKNGERDKEDLKLDKRFLLLSLTLPLVLFALWVLSLPILPFLIVAVAIQIVLLTDYLYRQIVKFRMGNEMNWPKLMLLTLTVPLHWLAFVCAVNNPITGLFVFSIAVNIGHSLQYHRLTWFHNRNRYAMQRGLSGVLSRSVVYYYASAFGLYLLFNGIARMLPTVSNELLLSGPIFMHYLLDARIWRTRDDPELARALNL
jgi:hypothetical protein